VVLSPLFLALGVGVLALSGPPVFFRQVRVGLDGRVFRPWKFRTMRSDGGAGPQITGGGDVRVTPVGRMLRAAKLDELPQLFNVIRGEMSLVGPRPEVPRYIAVYTPARKRVFEIRPGLTDPASLRFRDEEALLGAVDEQDRERFYVEEVLPQKLAMNFDYIDRAGLVLDLRLLLRTVKVVILPSRT
jgi:lipopolysaccharide/colanic/teichoic acid biosynthesis glycosyltransferase